MNDTSRDYPEPSEQVEQIDDLPQFREVIEVTSILRPVPPPARSSQSAARRAFLNEAARVRACRAVRPTRVRFQFVRTLAPVAAVLIVLIGFLGGTVAAAQTAAPDSLLYPEKLAWEDVRLTLATDPQQRAELTLTFAETRVAEIASMVAADRPVPEAVRLRLEAQLQQALRYAAQLPEGPMNQFLRHMETRVRLRVQEMYQAMDHAPEQHQTMLQWTVMVLERSQEMAASGQGDPAAFRELGNSEAGFSLGRSPTAAEPTSSSTGPGPNPTAGATTSRGSGANTSTGPGPGHAPGETADPTVLPISPSSPPPQPTQGRTDNTPGRPENTPGPPEDTSNRPENTPGQPDKTPGSGRP